MNCAEGETIRWYLLTATLRTVSADDSPAAVSASCWFWASTSAVLARDRVGLEVLLDDREAERHAPHREHREQHAEHEQARGQGLQAAARSGGGRRDGGAGRRPAGARRHAAQAPGAGAPSAPGGGHLRPPA